MTDETRQPPADAASHGMTPKELDDLHVWLRHGRIGMGRGYQEEVARARRIEADQLTAYQRPEVSR